MKRFLRRQLGLIGFLFVQIPAARGFPGGRFEDGLTQALEEISNVQVQHFPLAAGDANTNELPDAPVLGQS